jgi:5-methyltetrahydropteroyltriglutamate--homocysteine methyltransferase
MPRDPHRVLTTHAGSLPRPDDLRAMVTAQTDRQPYDEAALARRLRRAVAEVVQEQVACGLDIINDGELSKANFTNYVRQRISGFEERPRQAGDPPPPLSISARDQQEFPEYFATRTGFRGVGPGQRQVFCTGPLTYIGQAAVRTDIENFEAALQGVSVEAAFLPAVAPGTIEHWLRNDYYPSDEAYLEVLADAMHEEYRAITDAGFVLQIDDPDLPDAWNIHTEMTVPEYRKFAALRVDALNHALRGIPPERVRLHVCWGSYHGPHKFDIPLQDIVDLILRVPAAAYSIEASNPCHEHEWRVWQDVKLPDGAVLIPGVVGHSSDFIEHPELVAERLVRYADLVGRENVMAGTDCGLGTRVGHPKIAWAKLRAMVEGARLATKRLWG